MWCIMIIPILIPVKQQMLLLFRIITLVCTQNCTYNNNKHPLYLNYCGIHYYVYRYICNLSSILLILKLI